MTKIATAARYEEATKTIRSVPENYWLASMDSWEGAVNHEANAKIMAAGFETLAALKDAEALLLEIGVAHVLSAHRSGLIYAQLQRVRAAIAKAEG